MRIKRTNFAIPETLMERLRLHHDSAQHSTQGGSPTIYGEAADRIEELEVSLSNCRLDKDLANQANAELEAQENIFKSAIESAHDFIYGLSTKDWQWGDDSFQASCRCVLRELNEAIGVDNPRLLMEKPPGQKLYALKYKELQAQVAAQQAKIDMLMLEYCPEEMTDEQRAGWARYQKEGEI